MQVGQGQGTDMVVAASRKGRMQSSESRVGKDYAGRSRVGDTHFGISKYLREECRVHKAKPIKRKCK